MKFILLLLTLAVAIDAAAIKKNLTTVTEVLETRYTTVQFFYTPTHISEITFAMLHTAPESRTLRPLGRYFGWVSNAISLSPTTSPTTTLTPVSTSSDTSTSSTASTSTDPSPVPTSSDTSTSSTASTSTDPSPVPTSSDTSTSSTASTSTDPSPTSSTSTTSPTTTSTPVPTSSDTSTSSTASTSTDPSSPSSTSTTSPSETSTTSATPSLSDWDKNFLERHNEKRKLHGVNDLRWNPGLAKYAQEWADKVFRCEEAELDHSFGPHGENLALGYTGAYDPVDAWYNESRLYDWSNPQYSDATAHFTQIIWKETEELGCIYVTCANNWRQYTICEYHPPGNWIDKGEFENNVLRISNKA